jgi:hypothetical protein
VSRFRALVRTAHGYDWRTPCPLYCGAGDVAAWRDAAAAMVARAAMLAPYVPAGEVRDELDAMIREVSALPSGAVVGDAAAQAGRVGLIVETMLELAEVLDVADAEARRAGVQPPDILAVGEAASSSLGNLAGTILTYTALGLGVWGLYHLVRRARARADVAEVVADQVEESADV